MFGDSAVKAIVAAIDGDRSCRLLALLDLYLIWKNPVELLIARLPARMYWGIMERG